MAASSSSSCIKRLEERRRWELRSWNRDARVEATERQQHAQSRRPKQAASGMRGATSTLGPSSASTALIRATIHFLAACRRLLASRTCAAADHCTACLCARAFCGRAWDSRLRARVGGSGGGAHTHDGTQHTHKEPSSSQSSKRPHPSLLHAHGHTISPTLDTRRVEPQHARALPSTTAAMRSCAPHKRRSHLPLLLRRLLLLRRHRGLQRPSKASPRERASV